ncbi:DUF72 domain-containing protein [Massilia sp. R2A-15]|uniref:DUF72 domain-containing protein n=1 Tax=Massilia sp. R2A-15 TaxID=3064278 RepID=UPI002734E6E9|nr:DUF72 domain-containing protein [Massilia sp. R2A-15]WLI90987.1 DUF72 domain-containing protein [Massilia sp. R2A-15]
MTHPPLPPAALIGCAGWSIPRQSCDAFPVEGSHLERYAAVFSAVEINSCFYRPHQASTYARWAASVPAQFRFSVKLPRSITHDARLVGGDAQMDQFAMEAGALGEKLGCVLVQLPPSLVLDADVAADFFVRLKQRFGCMLALEARNPTWFGEEATAILHAAGVTRVIADPPKGQPGEHVPTAQHIYIRLHGAPRVYYSDYELPWLAQLGHDMAGHIAAGRAVWCVFDNTMSKTFVDQALALQDAVRNAQAPEQASGTLDLARGMLG